MTDKKLVNQIITREKTNICRQVVQHFSSICKAELLIKNDCKTCPFILYRNNIELEVMKNNLTREPLLMTMLSSIPNPSPFYVCK